MNGDTLPEKISNTKSTRPYKAGKQIAEALCETAHILYLLDNRDQYLRGIKDRIEEELRR